MPPAIEGVGRSRNGFINILCGVSRKSANQVARVGGISILEPLVAAARNPAAINEIMICPGALDRPRRARFLFHKLEVRGQWLEVSVSVCPSSVISHQSSVISLTSNLCPQTSTDK